MKLSKLIEKFDFDKQMGEYELLETESGEPLPDAKHRFNQLGMNTAGNHNIRT